MITALFPSLPCTMRQLSESVPALSCPSHRFINILFDYKAFMRSCQRSKIIYHCAGLRTQLKPKQQSENRSPTTPDVIKSIMAAMTLAAPNLSQRYADTNIHDRSHIRSKYLAMLGFRIINTIHASRIKMTSNLQYRFKH